MTQEEFNNLQIGDSVSGLSGYSFSIIKKNSDSTYVGIRIIDVTNPAAWRKIKTPIEPPAQPDCTHENVKYWASKGIERKWCINCGKQVLT